MLHASVSSKRPSIIFYYYIFCSFITILRYSVFNEYLTFCSLSSKLSIFQALMLFYNYFFSHQGKEEPNSHLGGFPPLSILIQVIPLQQNTVLFFRFTFPFLNHIFIIIFAITLHYITKNCK